MKQRPIPTAPEHHPKRQENQDHIEALYKDDSLKVFAKPIVSVKFLSYFLGSVAFGFAAGIVGYLFATSFLAARLGVTSTDVSGTANPPSWDILTSFTTTTTNTESEQTQKIVSLVSSSLVSVFPQKAQNVTDLERAYTPDQAVASGVVVTSDGFILTQAESLDAQGKYVVMTSDGKLYAVVKVIVDPAAQTAWLKIDATQLRPVELAQTQDIFFGQEAFILKSRLPARQPFVVKNAVSEFYIPDPQEILSSEKLNVFLSLAQTSQEFLPGAAVFDDQARLLGVTYKFSEGEYYVYPSYVIKVALSALLKQSVFPAAVLGVSYQNVYDVKNFSDNQNLPVFGAYVQTVAGNSPAFIADLQLGDIITAVDGEAVEEAHDIFYLLLSHQPRDTVQLTFYRKGEEKHALVTLGGIEAGEEGAAAAE